MPDEPAATATTDPAPPQEPSAPRNEDKPLGEAGEKALEAFKQRAKEAEKRAKDLEAQVSDFQERDKSETEKLAAKAAKAEQAKAEAEGKLLRYEIASVKEIPAEAFDLLSGNSREELEASADKILALVKSRSESNTEPNFDGGAREPAPDPETPEDAHSKLILKLAGYNP